METKRLPVVTVEQQIEMGIRQQSKSFVPALIDQRPAAAEILPRHAAVLQQSSHIIDAPLSATQHIEMKTSATDRAWGFLIASLPRTFAFSLAVTIAGIALGEWSLFTALVVLFCVFSVVELASYIVTLLLSAEGVSFYEARQKWQVIRDEQRARWEHYREISK